jgi:hypothetical protein
MVVCDDTCGHTTATWLVIIFLRERMKFNVSFAFSCALSLCSYIMWKLFASVIILNMVLSVVIKSYTP